MKTTTKIELYYAEECLRGQFIRNCDDLDDARIHAAARPAFRFVVEVWDAADEFGNRELLHREFLNCPESWNRADRPMKTIVYLEDGSIEATTWADTHVASGIARFATAEEIRSYWQRFERDDQRLAELEAESR